MKQVVLLIAAIFYFGISFSQKRNKKLQLKLEETIHGFNGDIGIYVKNLRTGQIVSISSDTIFPTQERESMKY